MAFLKLPSEMAYATGAIKTNVGLRDFARKLCRAGMKSSVSNGALHIHCGGDEWTFADWVPNGLGQTGWLTMSTEGDIGTLSRRLAAISVRHKFDHSRPFDLETYDTRCVTQYAYHWNDEYGFVGLSQMPSIETFDERL